MVLAGLLKGLCHESMYKWLTVHCNESPIYVFTEKELRGLSPNFHIHVSVSDLYIYSQDQPHIPVVE